MSRRKLLFKVFNLLIVACFCLMNAYNSPLPPIMFYRSCNMLWIMIISVILSFISFWYMLIVLSSVQ